MSQKYILYPAGKNLYSKVSLTASPWDSDATDLVEVGDQGMYAVDIAAPYIFVGEASTAASTDTQVGTVGDFFYGDVDGGDVFMLQRMHAWDWTHAPTFDKVQVLYHAKTLIDKFNFFGTKIDPDQHLEFPRQCVNPSDDSDVTEVNGGEIPTEIVEAAYLIADALLSGRDPDEDFESMRVKVETFGPVRTEYATDKSAGDHVSNLIPSPAAWARIQPWLKIARTFDIDKG